MSRGLRIVGGPDRGTFFDLRQGTYLIGRDENASIQLESTMVSRRHAEIKVGREQVIVRDLGSSNGTVVNYRRVDEQELVHGDRIFIGDFILEVVLPMEASALGSSETDGRIEGENGTVHGKGPGFMPGIDWKIKAIVLIVAIVLVDHLIISRMFSERLVNEITESTLKRARATAMFLAERNKDDLAAGNENLLDTDSVLSEDGVISAFIASRDGRILSPTFKLNQEVTDETSLKALKTDKQEVFRGPRLRGGIYRFATPIRVFRDDQGVYETIGIASVDFSPKNLASVQESLRRITLLALTLVPLAALAIFFLLRQITIPPISYLSDKINLLFRGEVERIDRKTPLVPLRPLIDAVNAAAVRLREIETSQGSSFLQPLNNQSDIGSPRFFQWVIKPIGHPTFVLNASGMILAVNDDARMVLEIREPDATGIHFEEVVTSEHFKEFLSQSLYEVKISEMNPVERLLEYGDFSYQVTFHKWVDDMGTVENLLIIIERQ